MPPIIVKAVAWFEKTAMLKSWERVADSQVVYNVRDHIVEVLARSAPPVKRAPRYPAVMFEAFEDMVHNDRMCVGLPWGLESMAGEDWFWYTSSWRRSVSRQMVKAEGRHPGRMDRLVHGLQQHDAGPVPSRSAWVQTWTLGVAEGETGLQCERPFLGLLYTWSAAVRGKKGLMRVPTMLRAILRFVGERVGQGGDFHGPRPPRSDLKPDWRLPARRRWPARELVLGGGPRRLG